MGSQFFRALRRHFRKQKLRTFLTLFIIGLTIIIYFGFGASGEALIKSQNEIYNQLNFDDLNVLTLGFTDDFDDELKDQFPTIKNIEDRLFFYSSVRIGDENVKCILIGIDSSRYPSVDSVKIREGKYFISNGLISVSLFFLIFFFFFKCS